MGVKIDQCVTKVHLEGGVQRPFIAMDMDGVCHKANIIHMVRLREEMDSGLAV